MNSSIVNSSSRRDIILREAARLFREKGYSGSTLRGLAVRSGVKGGTIYHHYSSKQEILYIIMEQAMVTLIKGVQEAVQNERDPLKKLRKAIIFHIEYHTVETDQTYVADAELRSLETDNYRKIVTLRNSYEEIYRSILFAGKQAGKIRITDTRLAARALLQMCTGISLWFDPGGKQSISEIAENYVTLFLWGICGRQQKNMGKGGKRK